MQSTFARGKERTYPKLDLFFRTVVRNRCQEIHAGKLVTAKFFQVELYRRPVSKVQDQLQLINQPSRCLTEYVSQLRVTAFGQRIKQITKEVQQQLFKNPIKIFEVKKAT